MNGPVVGSPGLAQDQQEQNSGGSARIKPALSSNGIAASTYSATMGGAFPTANGIAASQYDTAKYFMHKSD